jgi:hypothetical protein
MKKMIHIFLAMSLLLAALGWPNNVKGQTPPQDDGVTLLLLVKPGADMGRVANIISSVHGTLMKTNTIQTTGHQVLKVQVPPGTLADAQNSINAAAQPDIIAVGRNSYLQPQNVPNYNLQNNNMENNMLDNMQDNDDGGNGGGACPPNDPDYPEQWALNDIHYAQALCQLKYDKPWGNGGGRLPTMTYIDTGVDPVYPDELILIHQLNFTNGADGVTEFPFDEDASFHGTTTSGTGGATTDNHEFIAGVASAGKPVFITMLRVASPPGTTITTAALTDALIWCVDHQRERGGPGPINVSINSAPPDTFNTFSLFPPLAEMLRDQGDLVVNGAGNTGTKDSSANTAIRRVAGTDQNDQLASFSTFGPFHAAAPATNIIVLPNLGEVNGTSQSSAFWSGSIAFLIANCEKRLNAVQADAIIFRTATVTNQRYHIPNLKNALAACDQQGY